MNNKWDNSTLAKEYAEKLDQIDWYEHEVNQSDLQVAASAAQVFSTKLEIT